MSEANCATNPSNSQALNFASSILPEKRAKIGVQALNKTTSITQLAQDNNTSRKFIYQQKQKAHTAIEDAFATPDKNEEVLFSLPVTKSWIEQFILKTLGNEYLHLLQFFLNHRRFIRSEHLERIGKSPAELMTGKTHFHWLEMLGFTLFKKAA